MSVASSMASFIRTNFFSANTDCSIAFSDSRKVETDDEEKALFAGDAVLEIESYPQYGHSLGVFGVCGWA
jgi:hypothetical protein